MNRGLNVDGARIELYNAAVAYAQFVMGDAHDFDAAMAVAKRLEDAAENFTDEIDNAPVTGTPFVVAKS